MREVENSKVIKATHKETGLSGLSPVLIKIESKYPEHWILTYTATPEGYLIILLPK